MSPKITVHGGPTNARETDVSPAVVASEPQDVAEDVLGRPTPSPEAYVAEPRETAVGEALPEFPAEAYAPDSEPLAEPESDPYAGMTLAELRAEADGRDIPSYGTKAQITERLHEADDAAKTDVADGE